MGSSVSANDGSIYRADLDGKNLTTAMFLTCSRFSILLFTISPAAQRSPTPYHQPKLMAGVEFHKSTTTTTTHTLLPRACATTSPPSWSCAEEANTVVAEVDEHQ